MAYTLDTEPAQRLVRLTFAADSSVAEHLASRDDLVAHLDASGYERALVDVSASPLSLSTMGYYTHAVYLAEHVPHNVRLAVVVAPDRARLSSEVFMRDVASNRGLVCELFTTQAAAKAWLAGAPAAAAS